MDAPVAGATGMMIANTAEADGQPGEAAGRAPVDRAEDDEREDERADGFGEERLAGADTGAVGGDAEADVDRLLPPSTPTIASRPEDRPGELGPM